VLQGIGEFDVAAVVVAHPNHDRVGAGRDDHDLAVVAHRREVVTGQYPPAVVVSDGNAAEGGRGWCGFEAAGGEGRHAVVEEELPDPRQVAGGDHQSAFVVGKPWSSTHQS